VRSLDRDGVNMNYEKIVQEIFPIEKHSNIGILETDIRCLIIKKDTIESSWLVILKTKDSKKIENFLCSNGMPKNSGVSLLIKSIVKIGDIVLYSKANKDTVTFGFKNVANAKCINYPQEYKKLLPDNLVEDAIKITYDIKTDKITYIKSYCDYKIRKKDDSKKYFKNFLFSIDENKTSLIETQDCLHGKVKNLNDVPTILQEDYKKIQHLNIKCSVAIRENRDRAYLYIKQSL